jgi:hypothetical protein
MRYIERSPHGTALTGIQHDDKLHGVRLVVRRVCESLGLYMHVCVSLV